MSENGEGNSRTVAVKLKVVKIFKKFQISLVTADGSVDCMECPDDQENKVNQKNN